jgi:hypothetical protein
MDLLDKIFSVDRIKLQIKIISIQTIDKNVGIFIVTHEYSPKPIKSTAFCPSLNRILAAVVIDSTHKHCFNIPGTATFEYGDIVDFDIDFSADFPCRKNLMCSEIMGS